MKQPTQTPFREARPRRYGVTVDATLTYRNAEGEQKISSPGSNISKNGMALFVPTDLPIGTFVKVEIPLIGEPICFDAVICSRDLFTYGVSFLNTSDRDRSTLATYCSAVSLGSALRAKPRVDPENKSRQK